MSLSFRQPLVAAVLSLAVSAVCSSPLQAQPRALLIEGAQVISLDPQLGDLPRADVLLRDGRIVEVGAQLSDAEAQRIDGRGKLLLPGLVDTHTHLWLSAARGQFRNTPQTDYFLLKKHLARHYTAEDVRIGTAFGALESLAAGVTTSVVFFHNLRGPEYLQASRQALHDSGIRARLLYGAHDDLPADRTIDLEHLARVARDWPAGRVSLGLGWRGIGDGKDAKVLAVGRREIEVARQLGLPVSVHSGGAHNAALAASGLLGPDVQIVHATGATPEQLAVFRRAGASLSLTPVTEQRVGYGLTQLSDYAAAGLIGIGIDGPALAGSADLFANMRLLALNESGARRAETAVEPRRILELATLEAARSLGLQDEIGSITPGKRADLILLDLDALNLARPGDTDPAALLVYSATPANVDTVIVDGIVRKRDGRMLDLDVPRLLDEVRGSLETILERAGGLPSVPDGS